ncbi:hypothetical protein [Limnothrix sp. PR1529]|uniref:hypothetical protein n=1 Tax=Limnothrix sp. PR1529 TaxID=1704291 RepID=UPI00117B709A|nr:hypothetical protein [Limnothrix sp. PR1529]
MYNIRTDITRLKSAQKILNEKPSAQSPQRKILNEADRPWGEGSHDFEREFEHVQGWMSPQREGSDQGSEHRSPYSLVELANHQIKSGSHHSLAPAPSSLPIFFFATSFATKS